MHGQSDTCHLLALPAELRIAIWEHLLVVSHSLPASVRAIAAQPSTRSSPSATHPSAAILRACKQIHAEATPILYGTNTFLAHASLLAALPRLLIAPATSSASTAIANKTFSRPVVHARVTALIRRFYLPVRLDTDPGFTRETVEQCFSQCEVLALDVFQAIYGGCDFGVLRLFEGVRGVGRAVVGGSVGDGRYARWLEECMMAPSGQEIEPFDFDALVDSDEHGRWRDR